MRKLLILLTGGLAFFLGSRAGRGPYESLERGYRQLRRQPQVQHLVGDDPGGGSAPSPASAASTY